MQNHSYENDFDLHENETACRTHFHMKGFALRLVLKQRHKRTRKWPIVVILPLPTNLAKLARTGTGCSIVLLEMVAEVVAARNYGFELALEYQLTTKHCLFLFYFSMSSPNTSNYCHGNNPNYSAFFSCEQRTLKRNTIKILDLEALVG